MEETSFLIRLLKMFKISDLIEWDESGYGFRFINNDTVKFKKMFGIEHRSFTRSLTIYGIKTIEGYHYDPSGVLHRSNVSISHLKRYTTLVDNNIGSQILYYKKGRKVSNSPKGTERKSPSQKGTERKSSSQKGTKRKSPSQKGTKRKSLCYEASQRKKSKFQSNQSHDLNVDMTTNSVPANITEHSVPIQKPRAINATMMESTMMKSTITLPSSVSTKQVPIMRLLLATNEKSTGTSQVNIEDCEYSLMNQAFLEEIRNGNCLIPLNN